MIRFQPDSLSQALMRYFDMAAPDANVYIEIPAPDIRFASIAVLAVAAALCWRRLGPGRQPVVAMLLVLLLSTAIWLETTGNGRYFMPLLVCAGPLAVGLICVLPLTRVYKGLLALLVLAGQIFVLSEQPPWNAWTYLHWKEAPYFGIDIPAEEKHGAPVTYATVSLITYSLIAPQFSPESRWINVLAASKRADQLRTDDFLRDAAARGPIRLIVPSLPWASLPDGRPMQRAKDALDGLMAPSNLRISAECRYLGSPGLVQKAKRDRSEAAQDAQLLGFWSCPVVYQPLSAERKQMLRPPELVQRSFAQLAKLCPRFFPRGESNTLRLPDGWVRHYSASGTRVYVLDNGEVWYKFWRSMNPVLVADTSDLLAGTVEIDCAAIRGSDGAWRSGAQ